MDAKIKIGNRSIGQGEPCFIIAEAGSNHDQKYEQAVKLIETAVDAGADAVKFQVFTAGKIAAATKDRTSSLKNDKFESFGENLHELYKKLEMPRQWLPGLQKVAAERGIIFSATPFDESAIDEMKDLNVPFYKIASFELVHLPLIKYAARTGKPVILSTGMATLDEIDEAVATLANAGCKEYALLHCGIEYPPRMEDIHLAAMETMRQRYKCPIGYSDHTLGITVPIAAIARGATIIEKHFTVNKDLPGPDHKFALSPEELKAMVFAIRDTEKAVGRPDKKPVEREMIYLQRGRRSLFAAVDIKKSETITNNKLAILRPGIGLLPKYLEEVIGTKAKADIMANEPLTWEKLEK